MTGAAVVQYRTTTDSADRNRQLIEDLLTELARRDPGGLHYQVLRFHDGVGFMHMAVFDGTTDPFTSCAAYREFHRELGERLVEPPVVMRAVLIDAFQPGRLETMVRNGHAGHRLRWRRESDPAIRAMSLDGRPPQY